MNLLVDAHVFDGPYQGTVTYLKGLYSSLIPISPEITFYIAGSSNETNLSVPNNVIFLGYVEDLEAIYLKTSVFIRLPKHDSLSAMVLEMLSRGRYILYNKKFPTCHYYTRRRFR